MHLLHDVRNALGTLSRTTFYKWLKRYQKDGLKGLLDRPKSRLVNSFVSHNKISC
ncbi:MAG: helix-turn-helix domain-containing protein [Hydrogenobaculum sp.]